VTTVTLTSVPPPSIPLAGHPEHSYQNVTQAQLDAVRQKHAWLVQPIEKASDHVLSMPFFTFVRQLKSVHDFSFCAQQLWHHSATFPKVMGLEQFPRNPIKYYQTFTKRVNFCSCIMFWIHVHSPSH